MQLLCVRGGGGGGFDLVLWFFFYRGGRGFGGGVCKSRGVGMVGGEAVRRFC